MSTHRIKSDWNVVGDHPWRGARLVKRGDGKLSYQCNKNNHWNCYKLSCPCKCHTKE